MDFSLQIELETVHIGQRPFQWLPAPLPIPRIPHRSRPFWSLEPRKWLCYTAYNGADRNVLARIDAKGLWLEELERNPARLLPERTGAKGHEGIVRIDLNRPMAEILAVLSKHPVATPLRLSGPIVVARDIAHAKLKERLDRGEDLPQYMMDHPVYYAGPAKTPKGMASGSFGPTTAGRMDAYVGLFMEHGGSFVTLAKGNRSKAVTEACKKYGGFYLGSIGGPAAILARDCIKKVEVVEYPELGMEAVWKIEGEGLPGFILLHDKGNDFFPGTLGDYPAPIVDLQASRARALERFERIKRA